LDIVPVDAPPTVPVKQSPAKKGKDKRKPAVVANSSTWTEADKKQWVYKMLNDACNVKADRINQDQSLLNGLHIMAPLSHAQTKTLLTDFLATVVHHGDIDRLRAVLPNPLSGGRPEQFPAATTSFAKIVYSYLPEVFGVTQHVVRTATKPEVLDI